MTDFDAQFVERIVRDVMSRLAGDVPVASYDSSAALVVDDAVLTEESLVSRLNGHGSIVVGPKTVITPTARDVLRKRNVAVSRGVAATSGPASGERRVIDVTDSATVAAVVQAVGLSREAESCWKVAADDAVAFVRTAGAGVVVFTNRAAAVTCRANRQAHVRAAVATDGDELRQQQKSLGPNVLAVDPVGQSFVTLRAILKTFATPIVVPDGWED